MDAERVRNNKNGMIRSAFLAAFPKTIPIMMGFLFAMYESGDFRRFLGVCNGNDVAGEFCSGTNFFDGINDSGKTFVLRNRIAGKV